MAKARKWKAWAVVYRVPELVSGPWRDCLTRHALAVYDKRRHAVARREETASHDSAIIIPVEIRELPKRTTRGRR